MTETAEIRVHGVSGTPPESLLEIETIRQVDGDDTARFFERTSVGRERPTKCEAFHWGTMTSGSISKALWLLLAPFGMINLAGFTFPLQDEATVTKGKRARQVAEVSLRLLGLVMTLLFVTTVAFVSIDLLAWQCGGTPVCGNKSVPSAVARQAGWPWRLPLGAAFPAAAVLGLGWLSAKVYLYPSPKVAASADGRLGDSRFWAPSSRTALLRLVHLTASLAVVTMLMAHLSTHRVAGLNPARGWSHMALWGFFWLSAAIAAWCVIVTGAGRAFLATEAEVDADTNPNATPSLYRVLHGVTWGAFVATVVITAGWGSHAERPKGSFPTRLTGFDWAFQAHYASAALLLLVLVAANLALMLRHRRANRAVPKPFRWMWWGMACSVLAGFAILLATGFTSGLAIQLSRVLGHPETLTNPKQELELPALFHVTALLWGLLLVPVTVLIGIFLFCRYLWPRVRGLDTTLSERIEKDYEPEEMKQRTIGRISDAWRKGRLKYRLHLLPGGLGAVGIVAAVAQGVLAGFAVIPGHDPGPAWVRTHVYDGGWWEDVCTFFEEVVGTWVLTGIAVGLAFIGVRAFRSSSWRRNVGILWDLLAFWPRLTHPIVPPPYGGRAVLALTQRLEFKTQNSGQVVLSGHSQGSLICVAAALTANNDTRKQLALLTHGSQLMWAYARLFPAYAGHATLKDLYANKLQGRWRNLHRWSDYIGGPVLAYPADKPLGPLLPGKTTPWKTIEGSEENEELEVVSPSGKDSWLRRIGPEYQLRDPHNINARDGHPVSPLLAHSAYYADPAYDHVVDELSSRISEANRPGPASPQAEQEPAIQ